MSNPSSYIIAGGAAGKSRLNVLADVMEPLSRDLITRVAGSLTGKRILDLGCGGGNVTRMLAGMAGRGGSVVGMDTDPDILALARQEDAPPEAAPIEYVSAGAADLSQEGAFDLVYARFLLSHLTSPEDALRRMTAATRPGGWLIVEDVQFSGHFCHPFSQAFQDYLRYYTDTALRQGQHPEIGPALLGMLRAAGLQRVDTGVVQPCFHEGPGKEMAWLTLDRIRPRVVAQGIAGEAAVAETLTALRALTDDPDTVMSLPRVFRAWGQRA